MEEGPGLDAREATAALRQRSRERLQAGFGLLVELESSSDEDRRDTMISLTPFVDCARRLGLDPVTVFGPIAEAGSASFRETFDAFVQRKEISLADFGWSVVETPEGPAYRFAWPCTSAQE